MHGGSQRKTGKSLYRLEWFLGDMLKPGYCTRTGYRGHRLWGAEYIWLQDKVAKKAIQIMKVNTKDQLADLLTKPMVKNWVDEKKAELCLDFRVGRSGKQKRMLKR
jgi:predicted amidophosphoribosyltransferase